MNVDDQKEEVEEEEEEEEEEEIQGEEEKGQGSSPLNVHDQQEEEKEGEEEEVQDEEEKGQGSSPFDVDHQKGQGLSPLNVDHQKDGIQVLEPLGLEQHLRSGFSTQQEPVANLPPHTPLIEGASDSCRISNFDETKERMDGKRTHIESDVQASGFEDGETNTERIQTFGQELDAEMLSDVSGKVAIGVQLTEGGGQGDDLKQTSPRLDVRKTRERSSSPAADSRGGSKRLAMRCEFFARGWCIKGKSCRFLHIKDHVTSHDKEGGGQDETMIKSKLADDKGLEENGKRSSSDSVQSAVQSGEHLQLRGDEELHMRKDGPSSTPEVGRESLGCKPYLAGCSTSSSPLLKDGSLHKNSLHDRKLSSALLSDSYQNTVVSPYSSGLENMNYKRYRSVFENHGSRVFNDSVDRFSHHCSSSRNIDALDDQKLLDSTQEYSSSKSTSLQHRSSAFPSSKTELSRIDLSRDTRCSSDYRTMASFDDWEPSGPFRPSFLLSQMIGCPESLYDPIRDSMDQSNVGDGPSKSSFSGKGGPVTKHMQANADPVSTGTLGPEQSSNKVPISGHIYNKDILPDKQSEKEMSTNETDTADTAVAHQENMKTSSKEEKYSRSAKADKLHLSTELPHSRPRKKTQSESERLRHGNEIDSDWKTDRSVNKESRVLKHFHADLVEFIKELLKPAWSEGLMSKDAYKLIVKKTVDKVINSLHPNQIPGTAESIREYLDICQPKLAKLIEAYVEKHGKS
ncbi:protein FRIGIDA-ESSENTIAL 1-like [Lycium ferocissimum]|uniref:protein FRIGIDA-ESSENTIAL 1-like n=1 Tax=Lycium ferocissimum TaxID=112874 RepID=UPI0028167E3D|nr:protein FRIGIDA-ESSENTIAL 1-like [Lycium ferocissimum]